MERTIGGILFLVYCFASYWAVGQTLWANKIIIGDGAKIVTKRFTLGFVFGWVLIPVAIIKRTISR